jgi:hypothetical protein
VCIAWDSECRGAAQSGTAARVGVVSQVTKALNDLSVAASSSDNFQHEYLSKSGVGSRRLGFS